MSIGLPMTFNVFHFGLGEAGRFIAEPAIRLARYLYRKVRGCDEPGCKSPLGDKRRVQIAS